MPKNKKITQEDEKTLDREEVERFNQYAREWWDEEGKFAILHRFNPIRLTYIRKHIGEHFNLNMEKTKPLEGMQLLDIGCGGGLLCEPMARLGAQITGIDVGENNIKIARKHAQDTRLKIKYENITVEKLARKKQNFDAILNMEVIEHVKNQTLFLESCCQLLKKDGIIISSTINRTLASLLIAIAGAEYILRLLPKGTHQWEKFLSPKEFSEIFRQNNAHIKDISGVFYNPITQKFSLTRNTSVNYFIVATK